MQKLQSGLDTANDSLTALRDKQKITTNILQKVEQDLNGTSELTVQLKDTIDHKIGKEISDLRDELSKTNLDVKHLTADEENLKEIVRTEREALRDTNTFTKSLSDQMTDADTMMKILEQRLNDTTTKQKATTLNLENLNTATLKLNEEHEHTKANTADLQASIKKAHSHVRQQRDCIERMVAGLGHAQGKVEEHNHVVDTLRQGLDQAHCRMQTLKDSHERATATINELGQQLAHVGATTQAVKAGLQEQSSLLLPNIHLDSADARAASARHGNLLSSTTLGMTTPRGLNATTPRTKYSKAGSLNSTTKGVGATQNQAAWA